MAWLAFKLEFLGEVMGWKVGRCFRRMLELEAAK